MRAARLPKVGRGERAPQFPDEVHLGVERGLREACLEDEEETSVEESAGADEAEHDRNPPGISRLADCGDEADGDARGDEDAEREVEDRHAPLEEARARRQTVELVEGVRAPLLIKLNLHVALRQLLEAIYEEADAVCDAPQTRRGREDERAAGGDEHGGRDHRRQDGQS